MSLTDARQCVKGSTSVNRTVLGFIAVVAVFLSGCSSFGTSSVPPGGTLSPQTAHAIPIGTPTPTPAPLLGGILSPVLQTATNLLPVCSISALSQADCGAIRNLSVAGVLDGVLGLLGQPQGYHPADIQKAYALPSQTAGAGQTIGIVVAYDDPYAESNLATYRARFGLPACSSSSGCLRKVPQSGNTLPAADQYWSEEASIDLDMASAVCPKCRLLLVEANSAAVSDLMTAIQTAIGQGATVVSNSYTAIEQSAFTAYDAQLNHPGVPIVAGAGDSGFGVGWPASSQYVTAVGGTTLRRSWLSSRGFTETVWAATGSGCSAYFAKPAWQHDSGCSDRTVADVAAVADPNTGVAVYDTYLSSGGGWLEFGGTSVATPIIAGAYALAGNGGSIGAGAGSIYAHPGSLTDITSGSNGACPSAYLCNGERSYDGPSGLGVPRGVGAF